jgi:histidinol-phosphate aminotransferase
LLRQLSLPTPIQKYFSHDVWKLDLSNNTNPYAGVFAEYPDTLQTALKDQYIKKLLELDGLENRGISADNVLFTVGSLEGIDLLLRTLGDPCQDSVCVPHPTFSAYEHWACLHNLKVIRMPLEGNALSSLSFKKIIEINPKMVFLCSPNNPTGTLLDATLIPPLCEKLEGFVVVDEAYMEFSNACSFMPLLEKYDNLIILRTFSKAWGLAGLRCGVILAHPYLIYALRHTQLPFGFSTFAQQRVRECLENSELLQCSWDILKESRNHLVQALEPLSAVAKVFPSETNFIFIILREFKKTMALLKRNHILVADWSSAFPNAIRVSVGTPEHNSRFLDVMLQASL